MNKKILFPALFLAVMFSFVACDDSTSSGNGDNSGSLGTIKGSFPPNGDENFYCEVTDGTNEDGSYWKQIKVNIPKYKGHVEKITYDETGSGTQYYEDSRFYLTPYEKRVMCLEFEDGIKEQSRKRNVTESYCENGVSYFVISFQNAGLGSLTSKVDSFEEDCEGYMQKWKDGEYDEDIERRLSR